MQHDHLSRMRRVTSTTYRANAGGGAFIPKALLAFSFAKAVSRHSAAGSPYPVGPGFDAALPTLTATGNGAPGNAVCLDSGGLVLHRGQSDSTSYDHRTRGNEPMC